MNGGAQISSPVGLVAGNGSLPKAFIEEASRKGISVVLAAHRNETDNSLVDLVQATLWVRVGQLTKMLSFFSFYGVKQVVFLGGIRRIRLFGDLRLDRRSLRLLAKLASRRDDTLLRGVAREFEQDGFEVIAAHNILKEWLIPAGVITRKGLSQSELSDAQVGWEVAQGIGLLDIGQAVVVSQGVVLAVEAVEGTDEALKRAGFLCGNRPSVVVKRPKPQQDLRLDLPTIGPRTVENMARAGCRALVVQAGKTFLVNPSESIELANRLGIVIAGWE